MKRQQKMEGSALPIQTPSKTPRYSVGNAGHHPNAKVKIENILVPKNTPQIKIQTSGERRPLIHPYFKNVPFYEAEKLLKPMSQGSFIIRPSSKGPSHLSVTWKVTDGIYQHTPVRKEEMKIGFRSALISSRPIYWVDNERFQDVGEVIEHYVKPKASHARDVVSHKHYVTFLDGSWEKASEYLVLQNRNSPNKLHYILQPSKEYPGDFLLSYFWKPKPKHETLTVTPRGLLCREHLFHSFNAFLSWFEGNFVKFQPRQPVPISKTVQEQLQGAGQPQPSSSRGKQVADVSWWNQIKPSELRLPTLLKPASFKITENPVGQVKKSEIQIQGVIHNPKLVLVAKRSINLPETKSNLDGAYASKEKKEGEEVSRIPEPGKKSNPSDAVTSTSSEPNKDSTAIITATVPTTSSVSNDETVPDTDAANAPDVGSVTCPTSSTSNAGATAHGDDPSGNDTDAVTKVPSVDVTETERRTPNSPSYDKVGQMTDCIPDSEETTGEIPPPMINSQHGADEMLFGDVAYYRLEKEARTLEDMRKALEQQAPKPQQQEGYSIGNYNLRTRKKSDKYLKVKYSTYYICK